MPKTKQKAYFFFMLDYKRREESKGRRFHGLGEVSRYSGPIWKNMDASQRAPYVELEKQNTNRTVERLDTYGTPLSVIDAKKRDVEKEASLIRNRVEAMITRAAENNMLERLEFCFISFGYFCALSDGRYVPAEVGAVRYSMEGGVMGTFNTLINPGALPPGKSFEAKQHSENYHQLPIPPNALGEGNFDTIAHRLMQFLSGTDREFPLLFTDHSDIPHVESILKDILNVQSTRLEVVVCPLAEMFFLLKKCVLYYSLSIPEGFPTEHIPQMLLDKDIYAYTTDIGCEFHEQQGNAIHCALSRCVRWAYVISDSCCLDLHIDMLPGRHIPKNCTVQVDTLSSKKDSTSISPNDAIALVSSSSEKSSKLRRTTINETCRPSGVHSGGFDGDYINLESSGSRSIENMSSISDESTAESKRMSGSGSTYGRGLIHPVLGLGRGRRVAYDNIPPMVSNRKSFK